MSTSSYLLQCNLLITTHLNPLWSRVIISPDSGGFALQRKGLFRTEPEIVHLFSVWYSNLVQSVRTETKVIATSRNSYNNTMGDYTFEFDSVIDAKCFHELVTGNITNISKTSSY